MERIFLLDRSGSMASIRDDTIGGFNSFIGSQVDGTMSLVMFDHEVIECYKDVPMNEVTQLVDFVPRGSTALLDAMGYVLKSFKGGKKTVVVLTDGEENASKHYTRAHIRDLIEIRKSEGWDFVYLGVDINESQNLGFNTSVYFNGLNTGELFTSLSTAMTQASQTGQCIEL
jgi:hypothetical protein